MNADRLYDGFFPQVDAVSKPEDYDGKENHSKQLCQQSKNDG